ncbi:MAG: helix-turn-helix transcriptional regulator [Ruminococcaceae bacterium]|nr:helix-turn-helix transcriptional regulator [Oscillospiraceae bacterium]
MGFGKKLEEKMSAKGLKQADIVRATGISKTTLSSMISRDNTKVDVEMFIRICDLLECDPMDFASEVRQTAKEPAMYTADQEYVIETMNELNEDGMKELVNYCEFLRMKGCFKKVPDKNASEA